MKKFLLALVLSAVAVIAAPGTVKADPALNAATNFATQQNTWLNNQWAYYGSYQIPVMTQYNAAIASQYAQATAAKFQSDMMALQAQQRAAANSYQLWANEYAHQQNLATQYANLKNVALYNTVNGWDTSFYNNQEMVLKTYAMMYAQYPFPQVQ